MSGIIGNGLSALLSAQRALQTTSHNIANANTDGYVRQRVDFTERPGTPLGPFTMGQGVAVADVRRIYDQYLVDALRIAGSGEQRQAIYASFAARVDAALGNPETGINAALQRFLDQVAATGRDPTSMALRQQLLLEGESLASRVQQLDSQLGGLDREVNGRLGDAVATANDLARQIASLNQRITDAGERAAPELLNERDLALRELAGQIDVITVRAADGSVNVLVGSGQSLVLGSRTAALVTVPDLYDSARQQVAISTGSAPQRLTGQIGGGVIGGLLALRSEVLDSARQELGRLTTGLAAAFNAQHVRGMDFSGQLGTDFFTHSPPLVSPSRANTGSASMTASIADPAALAGRDYEARYDGSVWTLLDTATGAPVPTTGTGTATDPLLVEGLSILTTAGANAGDRFLIRPAASTAGSLRVLLNDPARVAAASPLAGRADTGNLATARIGTPAVADIADPKLLVSATIEFITPTTYTVTTDGTDTVGPLPYVSDGEITFGGWRVAITGAPAAGDRFTVSAAGAGSGDNSNLVALAQVAQQGYFSGGVQSIVNLGADLVATAGSIAFRSAGELQVQQALREHAALDVESLSGVNLDEEAADMMRYQEAYMAASKVVGMANDLFQNLLAVLGR